MTVFKEDLFSGQTTFVVGGTSGINLGIAEAMGKLGSKIFVVSRSQDKVVAAISRLTEMGIEADGFSADVRDYDAIYQAARTCSEKFGDIDNVISGAAGNFVSPAEQLTSNGFKTVVDIDLVGTFNVCRAAFDFVNKKGAAMINISAVQAFTPMVGQAHVCAAKAGIEALTKVLAIEWGSKSIRVNAIAPGAVGETEGMRRLTPTKEHEERYMKHIPLGRYAKIEEVADTAIFLCSSAGDNFTGEVVVCDGGQSILGGGGFKEAWS
ncbi:putative 2,4-dienoyl-CoA reductase [Zhongshania aliphaticivorans]|uniref:Putative 2,4-dienoyl-CoA reductase n=1 Tax=Zhongshania aliphaticivorans TaxID=1470434 RepID=A0A5S9PK37_9GAMM|nr:SDR family oxidoreductase [Zhongshania aliphaticivorans]CAA0104167.1 putative 2,4-dienoyl-CoA reductase [Zhongshania aliphaticivorans]CAA0104338.1 putative 2,4-dienoyl-CoA reductase [Zhongshania aliphaticivorans]